MRKAAAFSREQFLGQDLVMSEPHARFPEAGGLSAFPECGREGLGIHTICYVTPPSAQQLRLRTWIPLLQIPLPIHQSA